MKPSFALDFRDGLVTLLHRTSRGWSQVGSTSFDAPDMTEALSYMRSTALGLSPRGITTKLIIPNEQILYTQVHAPGPEPVKRRRQIRAGLEGLTPYALDDLVYDWWGTGTELQVAVLAKETLAEAEAFANEHRFNPVSFVAVPENGAYLAEPFFGASALSTTLLAQGEKVERDAEPVTVVARDFPRAEPIAAPQPKAEPVLAAEPKIEPAPEPDAAPAAEPMAGRAPEKRPAEDLPPNDPVVTEVAAAPVAEMIAVEPALAKVSPSLPDFEDKVRPPAPVAETAPPAPIAPERPVDVPEAPMVMDVAADPVALADDDIPQAPAAAIVAAFASRRSAAIAAATAGTAKPAAAPDARVPTVGPAPSQRPTVPRPTLAKPAASLAPTAVKPTAAPIRPAAAKPLKSVTASVTAPGILGAKRERNVVPMISAADGKDPSAAKTATKALTGLGSRAPAVKGKPRYLGLILTVLLLLMLIAVAVWSSSSLGTNDTSGTGAGTPGAADQAQVASPAVTEPAATAPLAVTQDASATEQPLPDATASAGVASADMPTPMDEAAADGQATEPADLGLAAPVAADTQTAAQTGDLAKPVADPAPNTEVSTMSAVPTSLGSDPQTEILLASADTPPRTSDPIALPAVSASLDANPAEAPPPPPFGTVYKFDADGRIIPTPEGILTPEGVLLIAGKPSQIPPERPADATPVATAATAAEPAVTGTTPLADTAAAPLPQDPTLAGKRPQDRPADLVPLANSQQGTATDLAPDTRFASLRPQARPAGMTAVTTAALAADPAAAKASLAANGFALATSPKPPARPAQLTDAVNDAVTEALKQPDAEPQLASANITPEAQVEPDTEAAAPSLPTNASVAKQATVKHALATNRIALLAVFGTPSTRFAMIRQANGAVKKVQIGDTIDGGRIAGITANAVQYQKGGQIVTLSLPTG